MTFIQKFVFSYHFSSGSREHRLHGMNTRRSVVYGGSIKHTLIDFGIIDVGLWCLKSL